MPTHERLPDGHEPYWFRRWRTLFLWRPGCWICQTIYKTHSEYEDHYITHHAFEEEAK
jgi:hypothetical protein